MAEPYGMHVRFTTRAGKGDTLAALLAEAAAGAIRADGCELYLVSRAPEEPDTVFVTEAWASREAHDASLEDPAAKELIGRAMPLLAGPPEATTLRPDLSPGPRAEVVTQLSVRHGRAAIDFYTAAFGAVVDHRVGGTDEHESVVAQLSIAGRPFWVSDEAPDHGHHSPESLGGATSRTLLVTADPGDVVDRAVALGATLTAPVEEQYGWLIGSVDDPFGHIWEIGRPLGPWPPGQA